MRRLIIVFVVLLILGLVAAPSAANPKPLPDPVHFEGVATYGAVEARTGDYAGDCAPVPGVGCVTGAPIAKNPDWVNLMDPTYNRCDPVTGTLTWTGNNTATLATIELNCGPKGVTRTHERIVHITPGGPLKMSPGPDADLWMQVPVMTGCDINGTFPVYHGYFDGDRLHAASHYHSICDGGTVWGNFGIGAEDGPIHVTYEVILDVVEG